jgi:hypothetical protein
MHRWHLEICKMYSKNPRSWQPGQNPTIVNYKATGSLVCFENKNIFFYFEKRSSLRTTTLALYIVVNSKVVGLAPWFNSYGRDLAQWLRSICLLRVYVVLTNVAGSHKTDATKLSGANKRTFWKRNKSWNKKKQVDDAKTVTSHGNRPSVWP